MKYPVYVFPPEWGASFENAEDICDDIVAMTGPDGCLYALKPIGYTDPGSVG